MRIQDTSFAGVLTAQLREKRDAQARRVLGGQLDHDTYKYVTGQIVAFDESIKKIQEIADTRYAEDAA